MRRRRFLAAFVSVVLMANFTAPAQAFENVFVSIDESPRFLADSKFMSHEKVANSWSATPCTPGTSGTCGSDASNLSASLFAQKCSDAEDKSFCLDSVIFKAGEEETYIDLEYLDTDTIKSVAKFGTPGGAAPLLGSVRGHPELEIMVTLQAEYWGSAGTQIWGYPSPASGKMEMQSFRVQVQPIAWLPTSECKYTTWGISKFYFFDETQKKCAIPSPWPEFLNDSKLSLRANVPLSTPKWLYGSIDSVQISSTSNSKFQTVQISGAPNLRGTYSGYSNTQSLKDAGLHWITESVAALVQGSTGLGPLSIVRDASSRGISKPTSEAWSWYLRADAIDYSNYAGSGKLGDWGQFRTCYQDSKSFIGALSTNALAFDSTPPSLISGRLKYEVADFHNHQDSSPKLGKFSLRLSKEFAKCLYKFTDAPISAEIGVLDSRGSNTVSTTTFRENGNWYDFVASGFTFSEKSIDIVIKPATSISVAKFVNTSSALSAQQTRQISGMKTKFAGREELEIVGSISYFGSQKGVALKRAQAIIKALEKVLGQHAILSIKRVNKKALDGAVQIFVKN